MEGVHSGMVTGTLRRSDEEERAAWLSCDDEVCSPREGDDMTLSDRSLLQVLCHVKWGCSGSHDYPVQDSAFCTAARLQEVAADVAVAFCNAP